MARWRLTESHYIRVPVHPDGMPIEWEYTEVSRETGRQGKRRYPVPLLLDVKNEADYNYPGEIIVCHAGKGQKKDYAFEGPPTPGMEPLDEEAEKISAMYRPSWIHPIESLPGEYSQSIMDAIHSEKPPPNSAVIQPTEFEALKAQVAALVEANAKLQNQLADRRRI